MHPLDFVKKWRGATLTERSAAQQHFLDLCRVLDVPTPADVDKHGQTYTFEKGLAKSSGGQGWADVWYRGHFAWEYKGPNKDLDRAYDQLLRYKDHLENPPLLVVSDLDRIVIRTNFTNTAQHTHEIALDTFAEREQQDTLRRMWTEPMSFRPGSGGREGVTEEAAEKFGRLAGSLGARGHDPHAVAHFLMQVLFCLFAEDIGLLPNRVFSRLLEFGRRNPAALRDETQALLETMGEGGYYSMETIPHINGGLFRAVAALELVPDEVATLAEASHLDWSQVEPAIFGTLFERSLDPAQRSQLGAHYTGRADILRVVEPVVLQPLRRRWDEVRAELETLAERRNDATTTQTRRNREADIARVLGAFQQELAGVTILDPACGSGNFLYVALNGLLDLEKAALAWGATEGGLPMGYPSVSPRQVTGLEVNAYAQELAQVVIWIGYLQWMIGNGFGWREPVLESLGNIKLQDALLEERAGKMQRTLWPAADFIIGNPPFLGDKVMRRELGNEQVDTLRRVYGDTVPGGADLCCYFFEQARETIEDDRAQRAGLLATNSIRDGASRYVLKRIKMTGDIYMAWSDEPWTLDGAAVRISIVGFDDGSESGRVLNGEAVNDIHSDLTAGVDITAALPLPENEGIAFIGVQKTGSFDIGEDQARAWQSMPANPNGKKNEEVLRRIINSRDVVQRPDPRWIIDFGTDMSEEEASMFEAPFEYLVERVKPLRLGKRESLSKTKWWLHSRPRPEMRKAIQGFGRYLATPRVAKHRVFVWLPEGYLPDSRLVAIATNSDYFFGVLSARSHELWSLRACADR